MCNTAALKQHFHHHNHSNHFGRHHAHQWKKSWKDNVRTIQKTPPANVRELDDSYELHLFAPGYEKNDFLIALMDKTLSISVKKKGEEDVKQWKRREYQLEGFVREFELNEKIDKSTITAKYENGVLILSLSKLEGFETVRKDIVID